MKRLKLVKKTYKKCFKILGDLFVEKYFKAFAWFGFSMYAVVVFVFVFRVSAGFQFS